MGYANIRAEWVDGNLVLYDKDGNIIVTFDGANRQITIPSGASLALDGIVQTATVEVDASGGGTAQTTAIVTLPVNSVVLEVHVRATEDFNGDTTQDLQVGVSGTADKYFASADFENGVDDINANDEAFASALGTPTAPVSVPAGESIIATWTNTASATTGKVNVTVTYYVEA